jgi:hypothetical protein
MPYINISSLILVFFILFPKASASVNDSVTTVEERGVEADAHGSYETGKLKSAITTIAPGIAFIFERIQTGPATSAVPPDTWACASSTIVSSTGAALPEFEEHTTPTFAVRVSAPLKPATQSSSPRREASTTLPTFDFSSAKPTTTASSSISSPGKRGVAYNNASLVSAFSKYPEVTWAYNWADVTFDIPSSIEYVPMLWGLGDYIQNWESNAEKAIILGTAHLLAFNEPDIDSQANLTVPAAVAGYLDYLQPFTGKVKLGSPAVTNGGGHMGLGWLKDFLSGCSSCTIDFIAIHWYNGGDASAFKDYIVQAHEDGGYRPVWITEFQGPSSEEEEIAFLEEVLPWLDSQDYIDRYAYFMASKGSLISGRVLSRIGETFASFVDSP